MHDDCNGNSQGVIGTFQYKGYAIVSRTEILLIGFVVARF